MKKFFICGFLAVTFILSLYAGDIYAVYCIHYSSFTVDSCPCTAVPSCSPGYNSGTGTGYKAFGSYPACETACY